MKGDFKMERKELVAIVGETNVRMLETENCEPTCRMYEHEDGEIEWMSKINVTDLEGNRCTIEVYYYTDAEDLEIVKESNAWDVIDFTPSFYEIY